MLVVRAHPLDIHTRPSEFKSDIKSNSLSHYHEIVIKNNFICNVYIYCHFINETFTIVLLIIKM